MNTLIQKNISLIIIGQPNSGKSTLINKLFGKPIVCTTNKPNSTRKIIKGVIDYKNVQISLLDTPGLGYSKKQSKLCHITSNAITNQTIVLLLLDGNKKDIPHHIFKYIPPNHKIGIVINKIDLNKENLFKLQTKTFNKLTTTNEVLFTEYISALHSDGLNLLLDHIIPYATEGEWHYKKHYTNQTHEDLGIQALKTVLFKHFKEEIPYHLDLSLFWDPDKSTFFYKILTTKTQKMIVVAKMSVLYKHLRYTLKKFFPNQNINCEIFVKTKR